MLAAATVSEWCFDYRPNITRRWDETEDALGAVVRRADQ